LHVIWTSRILYSSLNTALLILCYHDTSFTVPITMYSVASNSGSSRQSGHSITHHLRSFKMRPTQLVSRKLKSEGSTVLPCIYVHISLHVHITQSCSCTSRSATFWNNIWQQYVSHFVALLRYRIQQQVMFRQHGKVQLFPKCRSLHKQMPTEHESHLAASSWSFLVYNCCSCSSAMM